MALELWRKEDLVLPGSFIADMLFQRVFKTEKDLDRLKMGISLLQTKKTLKKAKELCKA